MRFRFVYLLLGLAFLPSHIVGQVAKSAGFPPLEQWKTAVIAGNAAMLKTLYSADPPARIVTVAGESNTDAAVAFWTGLKARRIKLDIIQSESPQAGVQQIVFQAEILSAATSPPRTVYAVSYTHLDVYKRQSLQRYLLVRQRNQHLRNKCALLQEEHVHQRQ